MNDFPQIKSTAKNLTAIAVVTVSCGIFNAGMHGELHGVASFLHAIQDGLLYGVILASGWLGMKSPIAHQVQQLFQSQGTTIGIKPSGEVTVEKTVTTMPVEAPPKVEPEGK